jgi:hypothetical protein
LGIWLLFALHWLHVGFAIFWFGVSLAINFLIIPAAKLLPEGEQANWWKAFAQASGPIFGAAAGGTMLFGIARGIDGGVLSALGTPYGVTWVVAIVLTVALGVWGARMTGPAAARLASSTAADVASNLVKITRIGRLELGGFFAIFTLMIAMRFGY